MTCEWLNRTDGNRRLILIFAGWGSDANLYQKINAEGWDVLVCYDFDDDDFDSSVLASYSTIYLYAWSLGVYAASRLLNKVPLSAAFAINGTEWPCHDSKGIPEKIFRATADTLSLDNLIRFRRRMFASGDEYQITKEFLPVNPDIEELRRQLNIVADGDYPEKGAGFWNRVYISEKDRIFPVQNQLEAWHNRGVEICQIKGGHYVDISRIVRSTIPDKKIVGRKFRDSLSTYDDNASAQRMIIERLIFKLTSQNIQTGKRVLEIGQGSGMSTQYFLELLSPAQMHCIDLYETPHIEADHQINYIEGDAEIWLEGIDGIIWDYVLSTSAIQWFTDPNRFFANAARCLSRNGILACTTFLPGNLSEFDSLRPTPMMYRSAEELLSMAQKYFADVAIDSEDIRITFDSPRDAIRHLRLTGVGGSVNHNKSLNQLLEAVPHDENGRFFLTYRPAYIIASNPLI